MLHMTSSNLAITVLLTSFLSLHISADNHPGEELLFLYNSKDKDEKSLKQNRDCNKKVKSIHGINKMFLSPNPAEILYMTQGFRKFGDNCSVTTEDQFYHAMLNVTHITPNVPEFPNSSFEDFSFKWQIEQWSKVWKFWSEDPTLSLQICNPRWLLECGHSGGATVCNCATKSLASLFYPIELEQEIKINYDCEDTGECHEDKKVEKKESYRCIAKTVKVIEGEHSTMLSGCELNLPYFGQCLVDCDHESVCTALDSGVLIKKHEDYKKFLERKVCCNIEEGCFIQKVTNGGQSIHASWLLLVWFGLIGLSGIWII